MSLEDDFSDVIGKAMRGCEVGVEGLAENAGVSAVEVSGLLKGEMNEGVVGQVCAFLGLDAEAVMGLAGYEPAGMEVAGITRVELPYGRWTVNVWVVEKEGARVVFDAGYGRGDVLRCLEGGKVDGVMITHGHEDHVGGVAALEGCGVRVVSEVEALALGVLEFGGMRLRVVDLSGHAAGAVGYFVEGFGVPVLVVGDAIFAGSMGRCVSRGAYARAFERLRDAFVGVGGDCVILPGHGPATTLGEELARNPFRRGFS